MKDYSTERWTLVATVFASSMVFIDFSALNVALPAIQKDFDISGKSLFWIINAYSLFLSSLLLVGSSLGDLYGRKKIFMIGIILFSVASFFCGISPDEKMLITARAIQGIGGALLTPGSIAIISAVYPAERRGKAFGTWSSFSAMTTIAGPVLGGWLAGLGLWRVIFFINIPLAIFTIIALSLKVPESRDESAKKLDIPGVLLAITGLSGITYGFLEASDKSFNNPVIQLSLVFGFVSLGTLIFVERKSSHPMLQIALFKSKTFSGVNIMTLFLYTALNALTLFLPLNLIQAQGYPEDIAGLSLLPFVIFIALLSRFSGIFADKFGARKPLIIGPIIACAGLILLTLPDLTAGPSAYWTAFFPGMLILGIGMGTVVAPLTATVMSSVPDQNAGIASGINNTMARIGGLLAVSVLGAFIIISFKNNVESGITEISITEQDKTELISQTDKLAEMRPPKDLPASKSTKVDKIIKIAFINAFDLIIYISAALALLGSITAAFTIKKGILSG